jgi:hypothetical protein
LVPFDKAKSLEDNLINSLVFMDEAEGDSEAVSGLLNEIA